ncbi:helix-turn-helix transcriptional regulator [Dysgonomonas capnocytophagoides]|nr:helix-turn-helix transcriptional regulator [Dysgonomonas capnocytophagoides]
MSTNIEICQIMNINEVFGKRVKEKRLSLNLSQETLANLANIDRTYLPDIEKGKRNVSLVVAEKIASALQTPLKELIE